MGIFTRPFISSPTLLCFTLLRKRKDAPFQTPIQGIYQPDVHDDGLRAEYGIGAESGSSRHPATQDGEA